MDSGGTDCYFSAVWYTKPVQHNLQENGDVVKLSEVLEELVEERGLRREVLTGIICEGLLGAYQRKYPEVPLTVTYDRRADEIVVNVAKQVVASVDDDLLQISLRKARAIEPNAQVGDQITMRFDGPIGRIEILKAKQLIAQQIRLIEAEALYKEFKSREGTIVSGVVYKQEPRGVVVKIGDALAYLPKTNMIPEETCAPGYTIRALLKEVLLEPRNDNQLILDRRSSDFLAQLIKLEIPEVYEGLVEIKKLVRTAGYKAKVLVVSHDKNIDPVGTCIGFGGARIKPILRELGSEKIDIIVEAASIEESVRNALKPAVIRHVSVTQGVASVWLDADQRSLAIGKMGQNISLAAALCEVQIKLMDEVGAQKALDTVVASEELRDNVGDVVED